MHVQAKTDSEISRAEEHDSKNREANALLAAKGIQVAVSCIYACKYVCMAAKGMQVGKACHQIMPSVASSHALAYTIAY